MQDQAVQYKNQLYGELARIGKGLSSDKRIEILDLLVQAPKTVDSIAKETGLTVANTSRHLQILKDSRLVTTAKDGNHVIYSLRSPQIADLIHLLVAVGENELSEMRLIQAQADNQADVKTISLKDAAQNLHDSFLLDVRPCDEFQAGHIESAKNIPLDELKDNLKQLPKKQKIIVYCRGRLCANSNLATQFLNQNGFNAYSLNSSYYDWTKLNKEKVEA